MASVMPGAGLGAKVTSPRSTSSQASPSSVASSQTRSFALVDRGCGVYDALSGGTAFSTRMNLGLSASKHSTKYSRNVFMAGLLASVRCEVLVYDFAAHGKG